MCPSHQCEDGVENRESKTVSRAQAAEGTEAGRGRKQTEGRAALTWPPRPLCNDWPCNDHCARLPSKGVLETPGLGGLSS